ncbi:MAG: tripartite tricarboxylate transporter substrate binding protein [Pseudomonadota bacterium]
MRRFTTVQAIAIACLCTGATAVVAQPAAYPARTIRMIVGFSPGGAADITARIVAERLSQTLGQQVVVDNRSGASGTLAADITVRSPADGYTISLQSTSSMSLAVPVFGARLRYDPVKDFTLLSRMGVMPLVLVVHPSLPARSLREFTALARQRPREISYASFGVGSTSHIAGEMYQIAAGVSMMHVPYKGSGQALPELMGGHVQAMFDTVIATHTFIRSGKLRALCVTTLKRSSMWPDLPTAAEAGLPAFDVSGWNGFAGPAGLPAPIAARLSQEINAAAHHVPTRQRLLDQGMEVLAEPPEAFAAFLRQEIAGFNKLVREAKLTFE